MFSACPLDTYKSDLRSCVPCPLNSLTEGEGSVLEQCVCKLGYEGPPGGPCNDIDECQFEGTCDDICRNTDGGYVCECSIPGYIIDDMTGNTCIGKCRK